ncbi:MAG: ABC transporter permease, partial [Cellulosilyticaceae bacterium]
KASWLMKQVEKRCGYEVVMALKSQKANRRSLRTAYLSIGLCFTIITGSVLFANVRAILVERDPRPVQHEMKLRLTEVSQKVSGALGEAVHQIEEVDFVQREKGPLYFRHPVAREELSEEVLARGTEPLEREVRLEDGIYQFEGNIRILDDASFVAYCEKIGAEATRIQGSDTPQAILYNQALYSDQVFEHERENVPIFNWKAGHKLALTEYMRKSEREETGRLPLDFEVELAYVTQTPLTHGMYLDVYDTVLIMSESTVEQIVPQLSPENQRRYNKEITYLDMDREDIPKVQAQIESIYARHKDKANYDYWDVNAAEEAMAQSMKLTMGMMGIGMFFIAMIGIVNIYSTISSQMVARRREFAMLKSIGISPEGLRKVLILESIGYSLKPVIIGVCLVTAFGMFLLWAIKLGVRYIFEVLPYGTFVGVGGALSIIVFVISYTLMRRIEKETIIDVLRDESY